MPAVQTTLQVFVFGENLDAGQRSLGYNLVEPAGSARTSRQVDNLARLLQATPYPEHWPQADLFCSVLLEDCQRIVAVARYGVVDHTSSQRRGGVELIGVLAPAELEPAVALRIYRWLCQRRAATEDLHDLSGSFPLEDILSETPAEELASPMPILPVRSWQEGCFVFAAPSPAAPNQHLGLLEKNSSRNWQWLPLCGSDFPFRQFAERGPLVAWTPDLVDVALRLEKAAAASQSLQSAKKKSGQWVALMLLFLVLLGGNLYALWTLPGRIGEKTVPIVPPPSVPEPRGKIEPSIPDKNGDKEAREKFVQALAEVLKKETVHPLPPSLKKQLIARYLILVEKDKNLQVDSLQGQELVGLMSVLSQWNADTIAQIILDEFKNEKTVDPAFIQLISERIRKRLTAEMGKTP